MTNRRHSTLATDRSQAAFASSDDWTSIQDPVERRKIQNRVSQRNYRRKIKSKLEELERMRSLSPDRDTKTMDVSAIKPASTARPAFSTPTSSHSAQPRFESAQRYSAGLWQQRSEAESSALPPVSCSFTMPPGFDCNDTAQSGYRALCAQCSLLFPWSGTPGSPNLKYDAWAPLASQRSGPFDEGYAAMNQAQ